MTRGYVTVDAIAAVPVATIFPGELGSFGHGGAGVATNDNVLTSDFMLVDPLNEFAQGDTAVHVEADVSYGARGEYTFYGREVGGSGVDNPEPLATT